MTDDEYTEAWKLSDRIFDAEASEAYGLARKTTILAAERYRQRNAELLRAWRQEAGLGSGVS